MEFDRIFSPGEINQYSRHLRLSGFGREGQEKLKAARVLCVGAGGLGSPLALYLAAAGVGTLGLIDFDSVDASNLQRQILHDHHSVGQPKVLSAAQRLRAINPFIEVIPHQAELTSKNALELFESYDVIADGSDNFSTRYLVNDACVLLKKPFVYGSIFQFSGAAAVFRPPLGPCYRCLYPKAPPAELLPSCEQGGVLGVLPGLIGTIQATEVIKILTGIGQALEGRFLQYDALAMTFKEFKMTKNPECEICGKNPSITRLYDSENLCLENSSLVNSAVKGGVSLGSMTEKSMTEMTPKQLEEKLKSKNPPHLLDVREPEEFALAHLDAQLVPLSEIQNRLDEIPRDREIVVYCHHGMRSRRAIGLLRSAGFTNELINLTGGIDRWSVEVDPNLPRY